MSSGQRNGGELIQEEKAEYAVSAVAGEDVVVESKDADFQISSRCATFSESQTFVEMEKIILIKKTF